MDDVVPAETKTENIQKELNITNHVSMKFHVEYGMPKTKYLRVGKNNNPVNLKLGQSTIEETEKYTYLGEVNNRRMNMSEQISAIEGKIEAAYQTLIAVAEDREFKKIKMGAICFEPFIT